MALTYLTYKATLANMAVMDETDPNFVQILPSVIDYAEDRAYRELDLLNTVTRDTSNVTANSRSYTLPQNNGRFRVVNGINIFSPVGTTATRNQLDPVSRDYLDACWPSDTAASAATIPSVFAMLTDQTVLLGSPPGAAFTAEVIGTIQPAPLSATNTTTYLTLYLPDLFLAASMVFVSGWQKNFGSQADDPKMAVSWESQYTTLFASANIEENRKKFASGAWGSLQPTPIATSTR